MQGISGKGRTILGSDVLLKALELLANPVELEKRINALADAERAADEKISSVGPADQVCKIRDELKTELEEAKKERAIAMGEAAKLVDAARAEAASIMDQVRNEQRNARARAEKMSSELEAKAGSLAEFETFLDKRAQEINHAKAELEAERDELAKERAEVVEWRAQNVAERERLLAVKDRLEESLTA